MAILEREFESLKKLIEKETKINAQALASALKVEDEFDQKQREIRKGIENEEKLIEKKEQENKDKVFWSMANNCFNNLIFLLIIMSLYSIIMLIGSSIEPLK